MKKYIATFYHKTCGLLTMDYNARDIQNVRHQIESDQIGGTIMFAIPDNHDKAVLWPKECISSIEIEEVR